MNHATNFHCERCGTELSMGQVTKGKKKRILCLKCAMKVQAEMPTKHARMGLGVRKVKTSSKR